MVDQLSATSRSNQSSQTSKQTVPPDEDAKANAEWEFVITAFNAEQSTEQRVTQLADLKGALSAARSNDNVVWLDIIGQPEQSILEEIANQFQIRHFSLLELVTSHQRSKFELHDDQIAIVVWSVDPGSGLHPHQTIMVPGQKCLLTLQPDARDLFRATREKLKKGLNKSRRGGTDYLIYTILNDVVDSYFPCLERYGERLEGIEDQIVENPTRHSITTIHSIKRDLLNVRRHIWGLRETINATIRDDSDFFCEVTKNHLRDAYEHAVQLIDFVEIYRELCADLMDVYLSSISNRMNEVMKVLTIITTVFVPAGLIASIYGMNFHTESSPFNMPELTWRYGYPFALALMFISVVTTLLFFWVKGWLGDGPRFIRMLRHKLHHKSKLQ